MVETDKVSSHYPYVHLSHPSPLKVNALPADKGLREYNMLPGQGSHTACEGRLSELMGNQRKLKITQTKKGATSIDVI